MNIFRPFWRFNGNFMQGLPHAVMEDYKLQALVDNIPPPTTVITPYTGIEKLSANVQFFIGAQIPVSLYQIIPGVSLRTTLGAYASCAQLKPKLSESRWNFFLLKVVVPHVDVCVWTLCCFHSLISSQAFQRALTASVDSCAEIKSAPQWRNQFWQRLEDGAGKWCSECGWTSYSTGQKTWNNKSR